MERGAEPEGYGAVKDKLEIVRSVYERWAQGDFRTADVFDPHVILVMRPQFPDAGVYVGTDGVARYMRGFLEPWTKITIEAKEIIRAGDSVVVEVLQCGVGDASGAETEFRYFHLWTFRGDKAIRLESVRERSEVHQAAGLA